MQCVNIKCFSTKVSLTSGKQLYKYLLKECKKLPETPKKHYVFAIKQSFKQHRNETDELRIQQMITKSIDDALWIIKKMFQVPLVTASEALLPAQFWSAVFLYHNSPHLINRRLLGITQLYYLEVKFNHESYKLKDILSYSELTSQVRRLIPFSKENISTNFISNILELNTNNLSWNATDFENVTNSEEGIFISVRILLPRNVKSEKCVEIVLIDKINKTVTFSTISESDEMNLCPNFAYDIELEQNQFLKICVDNIELAELKSSDWLAENLFTKLLSWAQSSIDHKPQNKSLSLVSVDEYCSLYHELKIKYGEKMTKIWPENTDPKKFVYEDISIATYLLLLWKQTSARKQTYVDLGCGNGLLVYILNEEGHNGYGIDVRPRKIWKMYPERTKLMISTIIPSSETVYPEADWLIGNHSDELTPWIPVMAARSSKKCNFFLLPCCSYEFNGKKYQRKNSAQSQYSEYLDYITEIINVCGFECEIDKLRIPSTKRISLIGRKKININYDEIDTKITDFIDLQCNIKNANWVDNYESRKEIEVVRNCTKLDKNLIIAIVNKVFNNLISEQNYIKNDSGKIWNLGGKLSLPDLVKLIPTEELKMLKKECGGLQTLLKNHHYIFKVVSGMVQLREPIVKNNVNMKTRECWFFKNHPDGCFLENNCCSYLHCE